MRGVSMRSASVRSTLGSRARHARSLCTLERSRLAAIRLFDSTFDATAGRGVQRTDILIMALVLAIVFAWGRIMPARANVDPSNTRGFLVPTGPPVCVWVDHGVGEPICDAQLCPSYSEVAKNAAISGVFVPTTDAETTTFNACYDRWYRGEKDVYAEGSECLAVFAALSGCSEDERCIGDFANWLKRGERCVVARTEGHCRGEAPCEAASTAVSFASSCLAVVLIATVFAT